MTDLTEARTLSLAKQHGSLVRWPGGFWTYPECKSPHPWTHADVTRIPNWFVGPDTIKSLLYKKLLKVTEKHPAGFATKVIPC